MIDASLTLNPQQSRITAHSLLTIEKIIKDESIPRWSWL